MFLHAVGRALPPHRYPQSELTEAFLALPGDRGRLLERVRGLHAATRVEHRHLALPKEAYAELDGFGAANDAFVEAGLPLAQAAIEQALARADVAPAEVDALMLVSVTGLAVPTLDARLIGRLGLRPDVKRWPVFGLGCVAGAAGLARLHDVLRGGPDEVAVLCAVELCSLTLQRADTQVANLIAAGLFADGAAAVVCSGQGRAAPGRPRVVATRSRLYPDSADVMGWTIGAGGFGIVLSARVPDVVREHLRADVDGFLGEHGLSRGEVGAWICHPGGPKVLEALQDALELTPADLAPTWASLREVGNLSSASVLFVLDEALASGRPAGTWGVVLAMGPGFCAELVLIQW